MHINQFVLNLDDKPVHTDIVKSLPKRCESTDGIFFIRKIKTR